MISLCLYIFAVNISWFLYVCIIWFTWDFYIKILSSYLISYKNYLLNLIYIFLLFYISVAIFEYFCAHARVCICANIETGWSKLNRSKPSRVEFSKKEESQWRQSETVVSTGMHNVHPARIEKSSQLDCVYCLRWFNRIPACFRMESLVSSRAFFKSSFFDICTIYN